MTSEFFIGFGLAFEKAVPKLDGFDESGLTRLKAEISFQKNTCIICAWQIRLI
jgi:hypothetical protein